MGHVRDLPGKELAVDVDAGSRPHYEVVESRRKTINELRSAVKKDGGGVILASDPDREGEAIAWHLAEVLNLRSPKRIEFHEITAGRVSSVALRLVVDREDEIRKFVPVESWTIDAELSKQAAEAHFLARLNRQRGEAPGDA